MQIQIQLVLPSQQVSRFHQGADGAAPQALVRAIFDRTPQSQNSIEVQQKGDLEVQDHVQVDLLDE